MLNIEMLAAKIGRRSRNVLNTDEEKEQVVTYGAIMVIHTLISIFSVIIFGLLFGVVYEALIFSIVVSTLRKYSGGVHASSPGRCAIFGTVTSVVIGLAIDKFLYNINITIIVALCLLSLIISLIIIYKKAPVDSIKKPITDCELKKRFKRKSINVILFFLAIILILFTLYFNYSKEYYIKAIECIFLGIIWQASTLTESGIKGHNKVDSVLKFIMEGGERYER